MTITFDVYDRAARLTEFLAEVEAGHQILIARGSEPLAHVVKAEKPTFTSQKAIDAILEMRSRMPRATAEEILEWRDEGRR